MDTRLAQPKDFLVSVRPQYAAKILGGEKTVELRRRFPDSGSIGATLFIYSSSPIRALVGRVKIKDVQKLSVSEIWKEHSEAACISKKDFYRYFSGVKFGFAIMLGTVHPMPYGSVWRMVSSPSVMTAVGLNPRLWPDPEASA